MNSFDKVNVLFEYPGQVIIVDDDVNFSNNLASRLKSKFCVSIFNSPQQAIRFFDNHMTSLFNSLSLISELDNTELDVDNFSYVIDYDSVIQLMANSARYNEPTVLIVDYEMPGMTGLEFLAHVRNKHVKKILLTAYDEKSIAVNAFNQGLIDRYLVKEPEMLESQIFDEINQLNQDYFKSISSYKLGRDLLTRLYDPAYENLLADWIRQLNIQEHYRVDNFGSVVAITDSGRVMWLALQSKDNLETCREIYNAKHKKPLDNDKMIYLFSPVEEKATTIGWDKFIYPIEGKLVNQKTSIYYTTIRDEIFSLPMAKRKD